MIFNILQSKVGILKPFSTIGFLPEIHSRLKFLRAKTLTSNTNRFYLPRGDKLTKLLFFEIFKENFFKD